MAFKIKSAKIFFWNKRTHSDVVVGSTLILARPGRYRISTGRGNEVRRPSSSLHPASRDRLLTKVTWGRTAVHRLEEESPRQGEAAVFSRRKTKVSLMVRLQSAPAVARRSRWGEDFHVNFNVWDRDSS